MQNQQDEKYVCIYCGKEAHYQFKNGKWCCAKNMNGCPVIKQKRSKAAYQQWKVVHLYSYNHKKQLLNLIGSVCKNNVIDTGTSGVCYYCGSKANYQLKNGRWCCCQKSTQCPVNRQKNSKSVKKLYAEGKLDAKLNYQNKSQQSKDRMAWSRGLTKETNQSVKKHGQMLQEKLQDRLQSLDCSVNCKNIN